MNKKIIFTVIPALAVLGLLVSFFSEPELRDESLSIPVQAIEEEVEDDNQEAHDTEVDRHVHKNHQTINGPKHKVFPKNFDYQKEAANLAQLKVDYPRSEASLMEMVLSKNEFAGAEPHSAAELAERQKGALKVETLKALFELEKDNDKLSRKLLKISKSSEDPVMRRIAKAAMDSHSKGRPFFSDTVKALGDLPIPE